MAFSEVPRGDRFDVRASLVEEVFVVLDLVDVPRILFTPEAFQLDPPPFSHEVLLFKHTVF